MDTESLKLLAVFTVEAIAGLTLTVIAAYAVALTVEHLTARKATSAPQLTVMPPEPDFASLMKALEAQAGISAAALLKPQFPIERAEYAAHATFAAEWATRQLRRQAVRALRDARSVRALAVAVRTYVRTFTSPVKTAKDSE